MSSHPISAPESGMSRLEVLALAATIAVVGTQAMMMSPLLTDVAGALGVSPAAVGGSVAVYGVTTGLASLGLAPWADRLPRGLTLGAAMAVFALGALVCALAPHILVLSAGQALCGIGAGLALPASYAVVGDRSAWERRGRATARVLAGWAAALILGVPLTAACGEVFGWRASFAALAALAIALAPPLYRIAVGAAPQRAAEAPRAHHALASLLASPTVRAGLASNLLMMAGFYGVYAYVGDHTRALTGGASALAGLLVLTYGGGFLISSLSGPLFDRFEKPRLYLWSLIALAGVYLALFGAALQALWLCLLMLPLGVAQSAALTLQTTVMTEAAGRFRGMAMALNSAVTYLGFTLGTAGLGLVYEALGYAAVTRVSVALLLLAAALASLSLRPARLSFKSCS